jgi:hypothetical protein
MNQSTADQIRSLSGLAKEKLHQRWVETFGQDPPQTVRKELLVPIFAYRIQERESGGLSHGARSRLVQIAKTLRREKPNIGSQRMHRGTRLVRSWKGELHEVDCLDTGFEYRSQRFESLSQIARHITGTRWSGPLFFGTKGKS